MIKEFKILNWQEETPSDEVMVLLQNHHFEMTDSLQELSSQLAIFEANAQKLVLHTLLNDEPSKLSFDLNEGSVAFRAKKVSKNNELIAKAIGIKPNYRPNVIDATAGMGRDAYIMARLGCRVTMQERCLPIYLLLKNALSRLLEASPDLSGKLTLQNVNSITGFSGLIDSDVIYLDPMFPDRKKSAMVKKEMRLFKILAGNDLDSDRLFEKALESKVKRVVVKRPKGAPQLMNKKPSHEIKSKNFRFDVYLT